MSDDGRETVAEAWASFAREVIAADAPATQVSETRRAFYAGAEALLCQTVAIGDMGEEAAALAHLDGLHQELRQFAADVAAGRA